MPKKTRHPGVVLINPKRADGRGAYRARYEDPDSQRRVWVTLDPVTLRTAEQRLQWAIRKSAELAKRRAELELGAPRAMGIGLAEGLQRYFDAHAHLRPRTLVGYRTVADKLVVWSQREGVTSLDHVTRAHLITFRDALVKEPKRSPVEFGKRGATRTSAERRSGHSVNKDLRAARTILGYLCDRDLLPRCSHDDLRRALKRVDVELDQIEYLRPHELQKLLRAALRHDAVTFRETRQEHASGAGRGAFGKRRVGLTPRYVPIAPFTAAVLLTGARFAEMLGLDWSQVDLEALGPDGSRVGEIRLRAADTKTKRGRVIALEVSPALRALLAAIKLAHGGNGSVFGITRGEAVAAAKRLLRVYGAPEAFSWQALRRTCGTYLTNAPGIFGAASAYRSAKQLGHSVTVAEKHYVDVARGIPREARTLESAMQVEGELREIVASVGKTQAILANVN